MRREQVTIGHKQLSYSIAETPVLTGGRQAPFRTVLFLHAFPLNSNMWATQLASPPAGWRFVAPDYRGFGDTPGRAPLAGTSMADLAGDAVDLLDALEVPHAVVAGASMGGYVAFQMMENAPGYVAALVLVDTRAKADSVEGKAGRARMLDAIAQHGAAAVADEMTPKLLGETTRREQPDLVRSVRDSIAASDPNAIAMAVTAMMTRKDMTAQLSKIKVPTLVIAGSEDTIIPEADITELHSGIKHSVLERMASAGHLPNLEQPAQFDSALRRFLERL